ncbi:PIG-L family deacetylase [Brevibacillus agri]|uniref:PIG-L deacetylase family protein n=1 Tax=Brevibacillus agri TaxID=51101 RepID=UPI002E1FC176|nr:PIG-L family deacetylase [Brevibacillus agri]MED1655873.1 PIG-L family deacetylase [Brevibacillus agri]MED1685018.1 PIG-L family deacetylase [Brevibacillus agri]MED1693609.1 PIG-L family deacetylase [Brevibacillus agri]MED1697577.1 PIG-L family deacetylase [Brevibacillus agri]
MSKSILVIAAHPDDEVLGCGGTIARHVSEGDKVHVVILAEGLTSRDPSRNREEREEELSLLGEAAKKANSILGVHVLRLHNFPDNRMDSLHLLDVTKTVENFIEEFQPEIVYTHHGGDVNIDHRIIHQAVITATRPIFPHTVKTLLFFETASSTEWMPMGSAPGFHPNWFVDISKSLGKKLKALEAYESEMRAWPHSRSIKALEHLAYWRGASSGVNAAEAFFLGRNILTY